MVRFPTLNFVAIVFTALALCACKAVEPQPHSDIASRSSLAETSDMIVTVLGSGTPFPSASQYGAAILVQVQDQYFVFDCGRGCTSRLAAVNPSLLKKVENLFITHMHSDHIVGIPDLWLNGWTQARENPLHIWGPRGTSRMMGHLREAYQDDIAYRRADSVPAPGPGLDDAFTDMPDEGGIIFDQNGVKVTAFSVDHSHVKPAFGYMIETKGRKVVISGDTTASENLNKFGKDADILFLEVMSPALIDALENVLSPPQVERVRSYHLSTAQASEIFQDAKPRLAAYYHTINSGPFRKTLWDETRKLYKGRLEISEDLMQFYIGDDIKVVKLAKATP